MVRFSKLIIGADGKPVDTEIREIRQSDIMKCPHYIMLPEHYNSEGTCKCRDPNETVLAEWGYVWDAERRIWAGGDDD